MVAWDRETLTEALAAARCSHRVWDWLRSAACSQQEDYRRTCLAEVRRLVGEDAFYSGRLPYALPFCEP